MWTDLEVFLSNFFYIETTWESSFMSFKVIPTDCPLHQQTNFSFIFIIILLLNHTHFIVELNVNLWQGVFRGRLEQPTYFVRGQKTSSAGPDYCKVTWACHLHIKKINELHTSRNQVDFTSLIFLRTSCLVSLSRILSVLIRKFALKAALCFLVRCVI